MMLASSILILLIILCGALIIYNRSNSDTQSSTPLLSEGDTTEEQIDPTKAVAMQEAREVAESYFMAARECDLEKANSYRLFPLSTSTKEECLADCPGGLQYKYIKDLTYNDDEVDGVKTELAVFLYYFSCPSKESTLQTYDTRIQLMRMPEDNIWRVINTL